MKVLVYLPSSLGAALLSIPCLKSLQANFPEAEIHLLLNPWLERLFAAILPEYRRIALGEVKDIPVLRKTANQLKKMNFDLGLLLDNSFNSALLFYLARIPERWGYNHEGRGFMLTRRFTVRATDPVLHLKDYYLNILKKAGLSLKTDLPRLTVSGQTLLPAEKILKDHGLRPDRPIIAIKPGSSFGQARVWPVQHQTELIKKLTAENIQIVLVGSPRSREISEAIMTGLKFNLVDLTGKLALEEVPSVLVRCRVFVGNDSGLTHLANFLGLPVVALFGPSDPETCGPTLPPVSILKKSVPCAPCSYKACPYDHRCLNNIQPDEVYQAIRNFL
jgi:heptosyltransferase-2